jgi:hypothetical protein
MKLGNGGTDDKISKPTMEEWSKWFDFNPETISSVVPEDSGLFKVHAGMKILYIGIAQNLRTTLLDSILNPCIGKGQRFSYVVNHGSLENLKTEFLKDYALRHNGSLPSCMEDMM